MSDEVTDTNSAAQQRKKQQSSKQQAVYREPQLESKVKRKRKSIAPKIHAQYKQQNQYSNQKQIKLTQFWKGSNALNESLSKNNNVLSNQTQKKKIEEEIQSKNKRIIELKRQRDEMQRKFNQIQNQKKIFQNKTKQNLRTILLQLAKLKRAQRNQINPLYGFFKDSNCVSFVEGPFLKQIKSLIQQKTKELSNIKQKESLITKNGKEMYQFLQRFVQKQLDQLTQGLKQRQKIVLGYRQRLKFSEKENNSFYARNGWPPVGNDDRFQTLELLGSGGFGEVYKCYDLQNNCYVALKQNRFTSTGPKAQQIKQEFLKHVQREVKIQKSLNHPNIAKFLQIIRLDQTQVSFILQYCEGPQLSKYLKKYQCLQQKQAKLIIRQILCALKYLYQQDNKIIHYDLKPSNIMFHCGVVKILDFGLCKQIESDQTRIQLTSQGVGTYWYLPPETFQHSNIEISSKVDIWSVGVIFFELLYGRRPFGHGLSQSKIMNQGIILKQGIKVQFPAQSPLKYKISQGAKNFISCCLKFKQDQRLSPIQAYQHDYFK